MNMEKFYIDSFNKVTFNTIKKPDFQHSTHTILK